MDLTIIGYVAGTLTTASFIPQSIKIWREKSAKDVSLIMYIVISTGIFLWFLYGLLLMDYPLILANGISFIISISILIGKIKYK
ncbi:MAG: SemiSWEET transporter [Thermoplasmata archaeon]|jgi:MtN3 and saliva related transmembrane protein